MYDDIHDVREIHNKDEDDIMLTRLSLFCQVRVVAVDEDGTMKCIAVSVKFAVCFVSIRCVMQN